MRRSKIVIPLHLVWTTKRRYPWIVPEIEERLHRAICAEATQKGATILAIGGMPDHIHVAIRLPATVTVAQLVQQMKGASSRLAQEALLPPETPFRWQEGYGAFAFHIGLTDRVVAYIAGQKTHHAEDTEWPALEETDEETPPARASGEAPSEAIHRLDPNGDSSPRHNARTKRTNKTAITTDNTVE